MQNENKIDYLNQDLLSNLNHDSNQQFKTALIQSIYPDYNGN